MWDTVFSVVAKVAEYLVAPVGRQLGYLFCYNSNLAELQDQVAKLDGNRRRLHRSVNEAEMEGNGIEDDVQNWLKRADGIFQEVEKFIEDEKKAKKRCCKGLCPNLVSRYKLSRQAKKKALDVKKSQEGGDFQTIFYRLPPPGAGFAPLPGYEGFESRNPALEKIMQWLRSADVKVIGVWGMGGVGKTTLVKQVARLARQENLFATEIYIDVSWTRDSDSKKLEEGIAKIQEKTAEMLDFQFKGKDETTRAVELNQRLQKQKILVILDDLWKEVNLEKVGIPSCKDDQNGCKLVLASRVENILRRDMSAQECFRLQHLEEGEAWQLFKKTTGDSVENDLERKPIAIEIVKECGGLPIAITAIAKTLLNERSVAVWRNALRELNKKEEDQVYKCLALSYNHLKDELKPLFLLCGCLSYGDISMYELLRFAVGLDLFDHIKSLEEARDKLVTLVSDLKASSLLLDGEDRGGVSRLLFMDGDDNKTVRMHDVIRDVARKIAFKDPQPFVVVEDVPLDQDWSKTHESKYISVNCQAVHELPQRLVCPKLQFFLLQNYSGPSLNITPNTFFEGMNQLKVLDLPQMAFEILPSSLQSLANLRTLCLDGCYELRDIAGIGKLKKLQVLRMVGSNIPQLPQEMDELTNLRLLDLNNCKALKVIPRNILSRLSGLECLFMKSSFSQWATEEVSDGESNACLSELNHLHNLRAIEVEIPNVKLILEEDKFFQNLTSYAIFIGKVDRWKKIYTRSKTLRLQGGDGSLLFGNGMGKLLEKIEELELRRLKDNIICNNEKNDSTRSLFSPSMPVSFHNLKYLSIFDCGNVCIPNKDGVLFGEKVSFPTLEKVTLFDLPKLKKIWDHNLSTHSFSNLRTLIVRDCPCLLNVIPTHLMGSLNNLKEMKVTECEALEHVFDLQGYDDTNDEILPKLETLKLEDLVELKGIVANNDSTRGCFSPWLPVSFHNLKCLSIQNCGKEDKYQGNADILIQYGVLFGEKVLFPNLEELNLSGLSMLKMIWHPQQYEFSDKLQILSVCTCPRLVSLIPSHLLQRFQNLKEVVVRDCEVLNYVFDGEGILPKVEILKLEELPKLKLIFNDGDKNDNMRYLLSLSKFKVLEHIKELHIVNCGKSMDEEGSFSSNLEVLALGSFSKLKEINFENHRKLKILKLEKLPKLSRIILNEDRNASKRSLLSPSTFKNFDGLKELDIIDCGMEERRDIYTPTNGIVLSNEKVPLFDGAVCNYEAFKSRAHIFDNIMDALRDDNINSIGVVGIGGVGKTTLIKQVAHQAMQSHLFTKQLYLDLSRTQHTDKLQEEEIIQIGQKIAKMLGWEDELWYGSDKAVKLKKRLKKEAILIILDGNWKEIHDHLEEIGIPTSCKDDVNECKIVLTSRSDGGRLSKDMKMGAQTWFEVETLQPDEALTLFEKTVVAGADSVVEENITELIKECEGVPLAIVTIANALKDETMDVWKNALEHLKNCAAVDGKNKVVYSCVEWSYTHLKDDDVKSLLLLCGQLDYGDISIDHLLQYAIGLDLFGTIDSLDQARNRLLELVEILKASSWLIELDHRPGQDRHNFVRMYDVVYDVVREIASKDPRPFVFKEDVVGLEEWSKSNESKRCAFLSLHCKVVLELPQQLVCPELQCFLLRNNNPSLNIPIPNTFFQGMKKLQVLDLSYMGFTTLPSSLDSLENLRTLLLDRCHKLEDIALIGKLTKLQVLSLVGSTIRKLPDEMEQLTNLRLLDLNDCKELEVIPHNVLSILSRLECLRIRLSDAELLPKDIQFENLTRYAISIGFWWGSRKTHRTLTLNNVNISLDLGDGIHKLLERSEELEFEKLSGINYVLQYPLGGENFVKLKHLKVSRSPEIEYIIDSKVLEHGAAFPLLESLVLDSMENLQEVWHGHPIPRGSFGNLKTLKVEHCHKLRYLFSFSTTRGLSQLENMTIKWCQAMEQIITYERESEDEYDEGGTNLELFPNLQTLKLEYLPKLVNFIPELETDARLEDSSFNHKVSFSKLEELELLQVPMLKDVWNPQRPFGSFSNVRILKWEA